jgi:TolA-binding protein
MPKQQITTLTAAIDPQVIKKEFDDVISLIKRGREMEAKADLKQFADNYPLSGYAPVAKYQAALLETDLIDAIAEFESLVKEYPDSIWADKSLYRIGEYNFLTGNYKEAMKNYKRYLQKEPAGQFAENAKLQIAYAQTKLGQFNSAASMLNKLLTQEPNYRFNPEVYDALAECYIYMGERDRAISLLKRILKEFPNYAYTPKIYLNLGLCLEEAGDFTLATTIYQTLKDIFPQSNQAKLAEIRLQDLQSKRNK